MNAIHAWFLGAFQNVFAEVRCVLKNVVCGIHVNRRLFLCDVVVCLFAAAASILLAIGDSSVFDQPNLIVGAKFLPLSLVVCTITFALFGLYRRVARSSSLTDMRNIAIATATAVLVLAVLVIASGLYHALPWNVFIIQFLIITPAIAASRFAARANEVIRRSNSRRNDRVPVLVVGTGASCDLFLRSLYLPDARFHAVGIVDDARNTKELLFHDVRIIGSLRAPILLLDELAAMPIQPKVLILTEPVTQFDSDGICRLLGWADGNGVKVVLLPNIGAAEDAHDPRDFNHAAINPEDILDRPQMSVEKSLLHTHFKGRRILITGAGGSIGGELTRQIAALGPSELVMIENCEFNAYSIEMSLAQYFPDVPRRIYVSCVGNRERVHQIFQTHRPELVFNAAALKHVPLVESNPCDGVLTNVVGTRNIADAAREVQAAAMIQISTDKAVNTTNVMGATKRVAELYCQAQDRITRATDEQTRFFVVRFGNVVGSSGSLVPLFQRQIAQGGPLTVTDPRMERFFMSIREAVELTLLAAAAGLNEQSALGEIFVLDMGKPIRIMDLAERMIRMAGKVPGKDIEIKIIGIRPGEKYYEELFDHHESVRPSVFPGIHAAVPIGIPVALLRAAMQRLEDRARAGKEQEVRDALHGLVPGYRDLSARDVPHERARALP